MKKSISWKLGITVALALGLSACSSTVSSDDDEEELQYSSSTKTTKNSSSSQSKTSSSSAAEEEEEEEEVVNCSEKMIPPTDMSVVRIAPSVWKLSWKYESSAECPETGFVIQSLDISKDTTTKWKNVDTAKKAGRNVYHRTLEGSDFYNKLYRVAAYTGADTGAFSSEVEISRLTKYGEEYPFSAPTIEAIIFDPIVANTASYEFQLLVNGNYPSHAMIESEYTEKLEYQFRWNDQDSTKWLKVEINNTTANFVTTQMKEYADSYAICHSYASVRIIWTDRKGNKDYTEWADPVGPLYNKYTYHPGANDPCSI